MPKKTVHSRVKTSMKDADRRGNARSTGRWRDEPDETHVTKHSKKSGLPGDAVFKLKRKVRMIEGKDYDLQGNDVVWMRPLPVTTPVSAHDATTDAVLWEWSAYHGDLVE